MFNKSLVLLFFLVFIVSCQQQVDKELEEKPSIGISSEQPVIEKIDEEFDDNLGEALQELEEIENI